MIAGRGGLTGFSQRICPPGKAAPLFEVVHIVRMIGMGWPSHLDVALNHCPRDTIDLLPPSLALLVLSARGESTGFVGAKIALLNPAARLLGMLAVSPLPEHLLDQVVNPAIDAFGNHVAMVVGPTSQNRIEPSNQRGCVVPVTTADELPGFLQHVTDALSRGSDEEFSSVFAHSLPQKVEPLLDVRHQRLFLRESQSALGQESDDDGLNLLVEDFRPCRRHDEVIGVANEIHLVAARLDGSSDGGFQSIEG